MRAPLLLLLLFLAGPLPAAAAIQGKLDSKATRIAALGKPGLGVARTAGKSKLPPHADRDHDGLANGTELHRTRTNPRRFDTDGDGFGDGAEVIAGSNPLRTASVPAPKPRKSSTPSSPPARDAVKPAPKELPPPADATPPQTSIDSGPAAIVSSTKVSFSFSSNEPGSSFECALDNAAWRPCVSPKSYSLPGLGAHSLSVRATDTAGNTDPSPAIRNWTVTKPEVPIACTTNLSPGADVADAVSEATGGAVICLAAGNYGRISIDGAHKSPPVTVRSESSNRATVDGISLTDPSGLRFAALDITSGTTVAPSGSDIEFIGNDITGVAGIYLFGDYRIDELISNVLIEGNNIHDLDYSGNQDTGFGYGIEGVGDVRDMTIRGNTIESPASDYIQSATPIDWVVDHNTFLGPSLLGDHEDHQDLWQIFGGGEDIVFTNNVARNTETQESLLFQEGAFSNVKIENNLFDHDSLGYTCQLYQSSGLIFRNNTVVGSYWGCLFRDLASSPPGSDYQVDHNIFVGTEASVGISEEGRATDWGTYDYNVSSDNSAGGSHSVRNWSPSWSDTTSYGPLGLPFAAGYRP